MSQQGESSSSKPTPKKKKQKVSHDPPQKFEGIEKKKGQPKDYVHFMDKFQSTDVEASGRKATGEGIITTNFKDLVAGIGDIVVLDPGWELFLYDFTRREA